MRTGFAVLFHWLIPVMAVTAYALDYSGFVRDEEGAPLENARVALVGNPAWFTFSGPDGAFLLNQEQDTSSSIGYGIFQSSRMSVSGAGQGIYINSQQNGNVEVLIHDGQGRVIFFRERQPVASGPNRISLVSVLQNGRQGLLFYRVRGFETSALGRIVCMNNQCLVFSSLTSKESAGNASGPLTRKAAGGYVLKAAAPGYLSATYTAAGETESGIAFALRRGYDGDSLAMAAGSGGIYNPGQILDYYLTMDAGDWASLRSDLTNSIYFPAQLVCESDPPMLVGVRRKRSGGTVKVGMKVDINYYLSEQGFHGLKKLSLENGISEGTGEVSTSGVISEHLAWRLMNLAGAASCRSAFARVHVNGDLIGVYVNVEQVDKRFLQARLGDNSGWLVKKSGGDGDGQKTRELEPNPHEEYFCFMGGRGASACPVPEAAVLESELPGRLAIDQVLRFGAVNAFFSNSDGPLFKDNNYYYYDSESGFRTYLPWDLDTGMKDTAFNIFGGSSSGGGIAFFAEILFPIWQEQYAAILRQIVTQRITLSVLNAELDMIENVAGSALTSDPNMNGTGPDAVASLKSWWSLRFTNVEAQLGL